MSERPLQALALHAPDARARVDRIARLLREHGTEVARLRPARKSRHSPEQQVLAQVESADIVLLFVAKSRHADSDDLAFLLDDLPIDFSELLERVSDRMMLILLEELRIPESLASMPSVSLAGMDEASLESAAGPLAARIRERVESRATGSATDSGSESPSSSKVERERMTIDSEPPETVSRPAAETVADAETVSAQAEGGDGPEPANETAHERPREEETGRQDSRGLAAAGIVLAVLTIMFGLYLHREVPVAGDDGLYTDADGARYALIVPQPFLMGSDGAPGRLDERPAHFVSLDSPFLVAIHEVTNEQYDRYLDDTRARTAPPPPFVDAVRQGWPVVNVSYDDARDYAAWQSRRHDATFRLPSEAEWEYVAGQVSALLGDLCTFVNFRGGEPSASLSPGSNLLAPALAGDPYCSYESPTLVDVTELAADSLGLRHLYGNAAEWVADCYATTYLAAPTDGSAKTAGDCAYRVFRGGSWLTPAAWVGPTVRARAAPDYRDFHVGFRLVRELDRLDAWALARPDSDWNRRLPIAAWVCYGLAFLFLLPWLRGIPRKSPGARGEPNASARARQEPGTAPHAGQPDPESAHGPKGDAKETSQ